MSNGVKAAVLVETGKIETRQLPRPTLSSDAMLLKTAMCGVCGTDVHTYRGHTLPGRKLSFPKLLGHEFVGTIDEVGKKANSSMKICEGTLEEGDRVLVFGAIQCDKCWGCRHLGNINGLNCMHGTGYGFCNPEEPPYLTGGYSEYVYLLPNSWLWKIPDDMPWEVAALSDPLSIGIRCIEKALSIGSISNNVIFPFSGTIVVQGSGAIGLLVAAAAKVAGAKQVIMTGAPGHRLRTAEEMGVVDHTINILEMDVEERIKEVRKLTSGGYGADVVIEVAGVPEALLEGLEMVRRGGTYVEAGNFLDVGRTIEINVCKQLCAKDLTLHTAHAESPRHFEKAFYMLEGTMDRFPYEKMITHKFEIEEGNAALQAAKREECMKAVLIGPAY